MKEKYFIHLLDTPVGKYIYDVNTNSIIEIGEGTFEYLKCGKKNTNQVDRDIQKMIKQGYLKTTRVEKAKNPSIDYIEDFLNNRVAYLVLQVTQGCNLRCKYCVYSGGYDTRTHLYELHHRVRLAIKPGITGMWQVSGRSDITDFEEVVRLDKEYITNWNIGLDIKILFKRFVKNLM